MGVGFLLAVWRSGKRHPPRAAALDARRVKIQKKPRRMPRLGESPSVVPPASDRPCVQSGV